MNSEVVRHFRNSAADYMGGHAQIFKAEGKLVPNLVRDNLSVRALHNKADLRGGFLVGNVVYAPAAELYAAGGFAEGAKLRFEAAKQGGFSAAGGAADNDKFALVHREIYIFKGRLAAKRILKAKAVYFNCFHFRSSFN